MFRKLAIAAAAAVTLGAGMASAPAPAAAQGVELAHWGGHHHHHHRRHWGGPRYGFGFGPGYYYGAPRSYAPRRHCERVVVRKKIRGEWRRVVERECYPRRHRHHY